MRLAASHLPTPIGELYLLADDGVLALAEFADRAQRIAGHLGRHYDGAAIAAGRPPAPVAAAFRAYFDGDLAALDALPVAPRGTRFQAGLWQALRRIPAGATASYGEMAKRLGSPAAARAVGHANGANPISIVVPCHRLVGRDGSLVKYGGGLERKAWLLRHEGALGAA